MKLYTRNLEPEYGRALCLVFAPTNNVAAPLTDQLQLSRRHGPDHPEGSRRLRRPYDFESFLVEGLQEASGQATTRFTFVLPTVSGYMIRSDFAKRRLVFSDAAKSVGTLVEPLQSMQGATDDITNLGKLLELSVAGILLRNSVEDFEPILDELADRITFPWLSKDPIERKRLVWVGGRPAICETENIWDAAYALGISLVIVDEPRNWDWLVDDSSPYAYYREAFVPMDMSTDDGFVPRLLSTVQNLQKTMEIDGVFSWTDVRLARVAKVCEMLGLPTSSSASFETSTDKGKVRMLEDDSGGVRVFSNFEEFQQRLQTDGLPKGFDYPLIVKPCTGWASMCITKANNQHELVQAASKASARHAAGPLRQAAFLVEKYATGPEFDFNIVINDGSVAFVEIVDDLPKVTDRPGATSQSNFSETDSVAPSALPDQERQIIQDSIHKSILRLGFTSGTFHCEGRVVNSSVQYGFTPQGIEDLHPVPDRQEKQTSSVFLHEINARQPGYSCSMATHVAYGVDYFALQQLLAVGDKQRFSHLAQRFQNGPQCHCTFVYLAADREGVMKTPDSTQQLVDKHPDLRCAIVARQTVTRGGQKLNGHASSDPTFLGWFIVASKVSRADCLRLAREVRQKFEYEVE